MVEGRDPRTITTTSRRHRERQKVLGSMVKGQVSLDISEVIIGCLGHFLTCLYILVQFLVRYIFWSINYDPYRIAYFKSIDLDPTVIRKVLIDLFLKSIKVVIPMVSLMCIIFILLCFAKKRDEDGKPYLHRGGSLLR